MCRGVTTDLMVGKSFTSAENQFERKQFAFAVLKENHRGLAGALKPAEKLREMTMKADGRILTMLVALALVGSLGAQKIPDSSASCPGFAPGTPCLWQSPYCGDDCGNLPFCLTTCQGADSGSETNLLYCESATYANCHYSGPPWATGTNSDNIPLPCKLNADNSVADCKCPVFEGPTYVHMNYILNLGVYYETVAVCGSDGSKCQNQETCPPGTEGTCQGEVPPVCKYITQQASDDPSVSLIPGADLISTYGYGMDQDYPDVSPTSTTCNNLVIANCMTAPCTYDDSNADGDSPSGMRYAQCACPTMFESSFPLSQDGQICNLPEGYVWE